MTAIAKKTWPDCLALPYVASNKEKAEQLSTAINEVFEGDILTEIFEDGGRWGLAVVEGMNFIGELKVTEQIDNLVALLLRHDLVKTSGESNNSISCLAIKLCETTPEQKALTLRARRQFRIEAKLDAILTALVGGEAAAEIGK